MTSDLSLLFEPRSVAVIGASSNPKKLGGRPIRFMKEWGYRGQIYPVTVQAGEVQGLRSYTSVRDIEGEVDQAIIVVPASGVEAAIADCIAKGVKFAQILSAGLGESGEAGRAAQERIVAAARAAGMRITGPNALGLLTPSIGFCGTFSAVPENTAVAAGKLGFATQSGAFGSCAYVMALRRGMGVSKVIATGNEADIDVADCIEYLVDDRQTQVICAAIEGCKDGDKFRRAMKKAARAQKPLIIVKVGSSEIGADAAATHTGALAGDDRVFETVLRECGAWRARSIEEMIDLAYLISVGGLPASANAAVLTFSGGIGVLMADAAAEVGLALPRLTEATLRRVAEILPYAVGNNPLDTTGQVASNRTGAIDAGGAILAGESQIAGGIFYLANASLAPELFSPMRDALVALKSKFPDRLISCVMPADRELRDELERAGIVIFEDPTRAVRAFGAAAGMRRRWDEVEASSSGARTALPLPDRLDEASCKAYLASAGLPVPQEEVCATADACAAMAEKLGFPVVAKIVSPDIAHKTEIGGVMLDLADVGSVREAYATLMDRAGRARPDARLDGVLIAPMVKGGVETILGVHTDPIFGPMIMFGLGGVFVELFSDVAMASVPLSRAGADRLIGQVKGSRLLEGWRGSGPLDRGALVDALVKLSDLAEANPEIGSVDINPFVVRPTGAAALDAIIMRRD
jgi:acetate---CoA ligase (ADP-forming)